MNYLTKFIYLFSIIIILIKCELNLGELTIQEIRDEFLNDQSYPNKTNCYSFITQIFNRIQKYDKYYNSIITKNPNLILISKNLDKKPIKERKSLFCVPVIVKDNIDVLNLPTSCGSISMLNCYPKFNSKIVEILINEDAIIIGKANLAEFGRGFETNNLLKGQTLNTYNDKLTVFGSSGGSLKQKFFFFNFFFLIFFF
jgi:amidase